MATYLIDMTRADMQRRLPEALDIYVDAMRYPRGTESQRASMWLEHTERRGWRAVAAVETDLPAEESGRTKESGRAEQLAAAPLLGVAYGYRGAPDQWWQQQVLRGLHRVGFSRDETTRLMGDYFELTELHIAPDAQGRGLGEALARRLLTDRDEANRAWRLYRRLGFTDIIRGYHFSGDPRAFAILGRTLPL